MVAVKLRIDVVSQDEFYRAQKDAAKQDSKLSDTLGPQSLEFRLKLIAKGTDKISTFANEAKRRYDNVMNVTSVSAGLYDDSFYYLSPEDNVESLVQQNDVCYLVVTDIKKLSSGNKRANSESSSASSLKRSKPVDQESKDASNSSPLPNSVQLPASRQASSRQASPGRTHSAPATTQKTPEIIPETQPAQELPATTDKNASNQSAPKKKVTPRTLRRQAAAAEREQQKEREREDREKESERKMTPAPQNASEASERAVEQPRPEIPKPVQPDPGWSSSDAQTAEMSTPAKQAPAKQASTNQTQAKQAPAKQVPTKKAAAKTSTEQTLAETPAKAPAKTAAKTPARSAKAKNDAQPTDSGNEHASQGAAAANLPAEVSTSDNSAIASGLGNAKGSVNASVPPNGAKEEDGNSEEGSSEDDDDDDEEEEGDTRRNQRIRRAQAVSASRNAIQQQAAVQSQANTSALASQIPETQAEPANPVTPIRATRQSTQKNNPQPATPTSAAQTQNKATTGQSTKVKSSNNVTPQGRLGAPPREDKTTPGAQADHGLGGFAALSRVRPEVHDGIKKQTTELYEDTQSSDEELESDDSSSDENEGEDSDSSEEESTQTQKRKRGGALTALRKK